MTSIELAEEGLQMCVNLAIRSAHHRGKSAHWNDGDGWRRGCTVAACGGRPRGLSRVRQALSLWCTRKFSRCEHGPSGDGLNLQEDSAVDPSSRS